MNEKIKSAIETFKDYKENGYDLRPSNSELFDFAIRSLQAWEEVLKELEAEKNKSYESWGVNYLGLKRAINIINQHLAEIEE